MPQAVINNVTKCLIGFGLLSAGVGASSQPAAQEITFFSNGSMNGVRFTVTGNRTDLTMTFVPRSARLYGRGSWEICSERNYRGRCEVIAQNQSYLNFGPVRSIRMVSTTSPIVGGWREIARLNVRDRADRDTAVVSDRQTRFRQIKVCSARNTIRIRRAEVQLGNGKWQRLFVPAVLRQGSCSNAIDLSGAPRRILTVRFDYEAWTAGMARGSISVMALPHGAVMPR